jgi:hypothetical protein
VLQSVVDRLMGTEFGVEVAKNPDADGVAHAIDCTRGLPGGRGLAWR